MRTIAKRSITVSGHKTSVSLEDEFWDAFRDIASARATTVSQLTAELEADRVHGTLSSAIRLFVLRQMRLQLQATQPDRTVALGKSIYRY